MSETKQEEMWQLKGKEADNFKQQTVDYATRHSYCSKEGAEKFADI